MLIPLAPIGGKGSVNPKYVTSVEPRNGTAELWVVGHAGYGTYSVPVGVSDKKATEYLNEQTAAMMRDCDVADDA